MQINNPLIWDFSGKDRGFSDDISDGICGHTGERIVNRAF